MLRGNGHTRYPLSHHEAQHLRPNLQECSTMPGFWYLNGPPHHYRDFLGIESAVNFWAIQRLHFVDVRHNMCI